MRGSLRVSAGAGEAMPLTNTTDAGAARRLTIGLDGYKLAETRARVRRGTRDDRTSFDEGELIWVTGS